MFDTLSGTQVDLFTFSADMVPPIEDLARGLANECRFHCQCKFHYSVAQHSILVMELCNTAKLQGLTHDIEEGIFKDMARQVKRHPLMGAYRAATEQARGIILRHYDINPEICKEVHDADRVALYIEIANVTNRGGASSVKLPRWSPDHAFDMFMAAYHTLKAGNQWQGVLTRGSCT